jgi:hypothetical protein
MGYNIIMVRKCGHDGAQGMTFGVMDAIINVIGILIGLGVVGNKLTVILGILVAGLANSFGNAAGFHVSEETEGIHTRKEVWLSTLQAFAGTLIVTFILLVPPLILDLFTGITISVVMGITFLVSMGVFVGKRMKFKRGQILHLALEYTVIGIVVIIASYFLGYFVLGFLG